MCPKAASLCTLRITSGELLGIHTMRKGHVEAAPVGKVDW